MNLVCIRHGKSDHNQNGVFDTELDSISSLTEEGIQQVTESAEEIKDLNIKFKKIYCSPLKRCVQTCEIVCDILGIPKYLITFDYNLRELEMGDYNGSPVDTYPYGYYNHELAHTYGGETIEDLESRIFEFFNDLTEDSLIVSHQAPIRTIAKYLDKQEDLRIKCGKYLVIKN